MLLFLVIISSRVQIVNDGIFVGGAVASKNSILFSRAVFDIITNYSGETVQNLINQLMAGTTEYRDNGVVIQHPPTATQTRAGKVVSELNNQNVANQAILVNQQEQINGLLLELERLNQRDTEHKAQIGILVDQLGESNRQLLEIKQGLEDAFITISNPIMSPTEPSTDASSPENTEPQSAELPGPEHVL